MNKSNNLPIFDTRSDLDGGVYLFVTLEPHYKEEEKPVVVKVTYQRKATYLQSGIRATFDAYSILCSDITRKSKYWSAKEQITEFAEKVKTISKDLLKAKQFSFDALRKAVYNRPTEEVKTLQTLWRAIAESKDKKKTKEMYYSSMRSFYRFLGCKVVFTDTNSEENTKTGIFAITGRRANIQPNEVDEKMIEKWGDALADDGKSTATIAVYMRAMRAVLYQLRDKEQVIEKAPKMKIESGDRRDEDNLEVSDIIRVRDFGMMTDGQLEEALMKAGIDRKVFVKVGRKRHYSDGRPDNRLTSDDCRTAADWWVILYLCNGCNMKDLIQLTWGNDYFNNKELTFVRSKTKKKKPVKVFIPVTDYLQPYLDKYASKPEVGKRVFPFVLSDGKHTDEEISETAHRMNSKIREGMAIVCEVLGIHQDKPITASTTRNSYATALTYHHVPDPYIDRMLGHANNDVLDGYQGRLNPRIRAKVNNLLFTEPEMDEDFKPNTKQY